MSRAAPADAARESIDVRVSTAGATAPLAGRRVQEIARRVLRAERAPAAVLAITFVGRREMARLNRRHLAHSGATDIVTLEHARAAPGSPLIGDIYIAPEVARDNARALGISVRQETARLVVHGVLHALGWQHPDDEGRERSSMWRRQEVLLRRLLRAGVI